MGALWSAPAMATDEAADCVARQQPYLAFDPLGATEIAEKERIAALMTAMTDAEAKPGSAEAAGVRASIRLIHAEYLKSRGEWIAARNAAVTDTEAFATLAGEIKSLETLLAPMPPESDAAKALDKIVKGKKARAAELEKGLIKKCTAARDAFDAYAPRKTFLTALDGTLPAPAREGPPVMPSPYIRQAQAGPCRIDTPEDRRALDPNTCKFDAQDAAARIKAADYAPSPSEVTIAGRPVDRRGLTASLTGAKGSNELSLSFTDSFRRRVPKDGERFQRTNSWGYTVGITTSDKNGRLFDFDERDPEKPLTDSIDRLNAGTKLAASLFYADYGNETPKEFDARSAKYHAAAQKACVDAQSKPDAFPSTCAGEQLMAWIFAQGSNGDYLHPEQAAGLADLYYGRPAKVKYASKGAGISFELARPIYSYKNLPAGATPAQLLAAPLIEDDREWTYGVTPYAFFRLAGTDRFGLTAVASLTYKSDFEVEDKVTVCPEPVAGQPFSLADCKGFVPQAPERQDVGIPSLELRALWSGARLGRFYVPQVGFAPKAAYDMHDERWEFSLPLFFGVDKDKSLTAGLAFIHRTGGKESNGDDKKDESGLAILIGKTFSLDPF